MVLHESEVIHHIGKHIILPHQEQVALIVENISVRIIGRIRLIVSYVAFPLGDVFSVYIGIVCPSHFLVRQYRFQRTCFLRKLRCFREREVVVVIESGSHVLFTLLRSNQNHTESCAGTVDSCGSGILQNRDRFNILRINHVDIHRYVVYQYERLTTVDGGCSTDIVRHVVSRSSRCRFNF